MYGYFLNRGTPFLPQREQNPLKGSPKRSQRVPLFLESPLRMPRRQVQDLSGAPKLERLMLKAGGLGFRV